MSLQTIRSFSVVTILLTLCAFVCLESSRVLLAADELTEVAVTTLADSGPGSLREAVQQGQRRITFRVAGTIKLLRNIEVSASNITIDGTTAPAPGVTVSDHTFAIANASHVQVRQMRFRNAKDDNLRIVGGCEDVLIENCSSTHGGDGAIDISHDYDTLRRPRGVVVRRCLLGATDKAMLVVGVDELTLEQNLFTNNGQRNPQLHDAHNFNFVNNVVRNFFAYGARVRAGSTGNVVANLIPLSPNLPKRPDRTFIVVNEEDGSVCQVYSKGNVGPAQHAPNQQGNVTAAIGVVPPNLLATEAVEATVLEHVGARPLDSIDQELVGNVPTLKARPSNTKDP